MMFVLKLNFVQLTYVGEVANNFQPFFFGEK